MKENILSNELGQRDALNQILKEIDTNKPSQSSKLSKENSSDYESISSCNDSNFYFVLSDKCITFFQDF